MAKRLIIDSSKPKNALATLTGTIRDKFQSPTTLISRNGNASTQDLQIDLKLPDNSENTKERKSCFLDLPYEIRVLVYVELFSTQTLTPFHTSESHSFEKWDKKPNLWIRSPRSFRPDPHKPRHFGLLLANRHCFYEGINYYYQHCLVLNATYLEDWQHEAIFSAHSYPKNQCFIQRNHNDYYRGPKEIIAAEGIPCNARLVIETTRRIVVDSRMFDIKNLTNYKSLQDVLVRMAHMEFEHWPELQETIPPNIRPTDDQLRHYHEGVLPAGEYAPQ